MKRIIIIDIECLPLYDLAVGAKEQLIEALETLGELLESRGIELDLVLIGGGALLLRDLISRPTQDMDIVAIVYRGRFRVVRKPLPDPVVRAIREVGTALDLPHAPRDDKDWLNPGPSFLLKLGLPPGFRTRVETRTFGSLTVRIAARIDLISLKLWAATDASRGARRTVDIDDLKTLSPALPELRTAVAWCKRKDGRTEYFATDVIPVLAQLGVDPAEVEP